MCTNPGQPPDAGSPSAATAMGCHAIERLAGVSDSKIVPLLQPRASESSASNRRLCFHMTDKYAAAQLRELSLAVAKINTNDASQTNCASR